MDSEKISVSLDEVNSSQVDAEIRRQDIAARMAAHQEQVEATTVESHRMSGGGFFRNAVVYMALFGFLASAMGWGIGEIVQYRRSHCHWWQYQDVSSVFLSLNPQGTIGEFSSFVELIREKGSEEFRGNPLLSPSFWNQPEWKREQMLAKERKVYEKLGRWWFVLIGLVIGVGLAIAEPLVGHNGKSALVRGMTGAALGALGGFVCSLFVNQVYNFLQGDTEGFTLQQVFARGVAWSILGAFLALAPGIAMRNWKKFLLGLAGGAIGGLLGGFLFDPICELTGSDVPARCVNIFGLGVGAAVATALLEEAAKQGWLKVATGVITGKQFILYRNPTVIGSSPKTEIYLFKDPTVAPKHAAINGVGGEFLLTALNGATVLLNGRPVQQQRLKNGDQIRVGNTIFLFGSKRATPSGR